MRVELTKLLNSFTFALDYVEGEVLGSTPYHGKRVAVLVNRMAKTLGMEAEEVYAVTHAAGLHDCALFEYYTDEISRLGYTPEDIRMAPHCVAGEGKMAKLPFYNRMQGAVLYHHEQANGGGTFGKKAAETPLSAQLIHLADCVDVKFSFDSVDEEKYRAAVCWVEEQREILFSSECVAAFLRGVDYPLLESMAGEGARRIIDEMIPQVTEEIPVSVLREFASLFAEIADYKSHFTWRHSVGIAEKAYRMGAYYGYSEEKCDKLYIAGALHDIGKLLISNDILEKPGRLTSEEYQEIQNHAIGTWDMLHGIGGLEEIARWAALHHEKLNGSGYPFGLKESELCHEERLMACLDIYQALVEERPYKTALSHGSAMVILRRMGEDGQLDRGILSDIDRCFAMEGETSFAQVQERKSVENGLTWRCPVCGYTHSGELPEDFICPRCEQPSSVFVQV